ncbi:MAG: alpha-glucan family phosphorylase [Gorillibacterium sp.]|nr:alpha-glucan family phosphorylase [Gorillibacterium sp.]
MALKDRIPDRFSQLADLAYNLWFSWNDGATKLFKLTHPEKWEEFAHNPVRLLRELQPEDWERLAQSKEFVDLYDQVTDQWNKYMNGTTWFQEQYPEKSQERIAYFSAEFGFHESLPIYSGGLGVLAGDHLKSASDLGLPLLGVGLLYRKGYFRQKLDSVGSQQAERVEHNFADHPVLPAEVNGREVFIDVEVGSERVKLKVWVARIGRISLYLLDSNLEDNSPETKELTSQLYGGGQDMRIAQEIILGVGGVKALRALGVLPSAYHINEGHAAFLSLERLREYIHAGIPYETALELVRSSTIFTTHTPVPAGHDTFPMDLFTANLSPLLSQMSYERDRIVALGYDPLKNQFNMTFLALHCSALRGGVSKLHGEVSRMMFQRFHGCLEAADVPIGHITNGVHAESWIAPEIIALYDRYLGEDWTARQVEATTWEALESIPSEELWQIHKKLKAKLINQARKNLEEQRRRAGDSPERIAEVHTLLNPEALTIGFARRFATYKRANLLFHDLPRLSRLLNHPGRPVQILFAGKAHPADIPGQDLIREIYRVSQVEEFKGKIVMLENYDIKLARYLVQGVDVWLNNPLRPLEASGTSGEKAALNGVLNFSVLDGWWEEGYDGTNGWSIESSPDSDWQTQENENAESLYTKLEQEIVSLYYRQDTYPEPWTAIMKRSIKTLSPVYNTHRMVQNYTDQYYSPTINRFRSFQADGNRAAHSLADFKQFIQMNWSEVGSAISRDDLTLPAAAGYKQVNVDIHLGPLEADNVAAEIVYYADNIDGIWESVHVPLTPDRIIDSGFCRFHAQIPAHLIHLKHYSVRVRPFHPLFNHRSEMSQTYTSVL